MNRSSRMKSFVLSAAVVAGTSGTLAVGQGMSSVTQALGFRALDAEYSNALDSIVAVATVPLNQLHVYDPIGLTTDSVGLPLTPSCVSVAPNGLEAVVGHDGWLSHVDLQAMIVLNTWPVPEDAHDVVHAGNGFAYVFPATGQWTKIQCVDLALGTSDPSSGFSVRERTIAKLHPNGQSIYGADNGISPSDIEKYDITPGIAQYLYDSPYHGDYAMGGDLWISDDGFRIFVRTGNVFLSTGAQAQDMLYNGSLSNTSSIEWLDHSSANSKIVLVPANADDEIQIYDDSFLGFEGSTPLPSVSVGGTPFDLLGRFVFWNSTGSRAFILGEVDPASGLLLNNAIATYTQFDDCSAGYQNYCAVTSNSTGASGQFDFTGSLSIDADDSVMVASQVPALRPGAFIFASQDTQVPFGNGFLCLSVFGGGIKRPWGVSFSDALGTAMQPMDFATLPGGSQIAAGSTQYFQYWFRDTAAGGAGFNLTNAAVVSFCD